MSARIFLLASLVAVLATLASASPEQEELVLEEVLVEAEFDASLQLQLQREPVVTDFVLRLQLRDEAIRAR